MAEWTLLGDLQPVVGQYTEEVINNNGKTLLNLKAKEYT